MIQFPNCNLLWLIDNMVLCSPDAAIDVTWFKQGSSNNWLKIWDTGSWCWRKISHELALSHSRVLQDSCKNRVQILRLLTSWTRVIHLKIFRWPFSHIQYPFQSPISVTSSLFSFTVTLLQAMHGGTPLRWSAKPVKSRWKSNIVYISLPICGSVNSPIDRAWHLGCQNSGDSQPRASNLLWLLLSVWLQAQYQKNSTHY